MGRKAGEYNIELEVSKGKWMKGGKKSKGTRGREEKRK